MKPIKIAGKSFDLRLTTGAVRKADAAMTRKTVEIINQFHQRHGGRLIGVDETVELLFHAIEGQHGILSIEQVDDLLDNHEGSLDDINYALIDAALDFFGYDRPSKVAENGQPVGTEGNA